MAQAGKTDLTGLAGAKSQTLVSLMYDKPDGTIAAMEVTEPLTQATLKLKHDPKKTPEIQNYLVILMICLEKVDIRKTTSLMISKKCTMM